MKHYLLIILCTLLYGCFETETSDLVVLAGDSVLAQAVPIATYKITRQDGAPFIVNHTVSGAPLGTIEYNTGRITALNDIVIPATIVISLGTNDRTNPFFSDVFERAFRGNIDLFMQAVHPSTDVYWIPPHNNVPYAETIVADIHDAAEAWPNLHVLNFVTTEQDLKSATDRVHLSDVGNAKLADLITEALAR